MYIFIDESGDFAIPRDAAAHRIAVVGALTFTDPAWAGVRAQFEQFRGRLDKTELRHNEPKWHLLSPEHRREYCELIASTDGASFTPVTLDLSHLVSEGDGWLTPMLEKLDRQPDLMIFDTAKAQIRELAKQARNLSSVQHLRIYSWAYALYQALYHAIIFLSAGARAASWNKVRIELDPVQARPNSREQRVFSTMVLAWIMGWSQTRPFITVQEIHTADHPFVRNFETPSGIDFGKLVRPNLNWCVSRDSVGVQMADLAAAVVYDAACEPNAVGEKLELYTIIMSASRYGWIHGPGLFSPLTRPLSDIGLKYSTLSDAMKRRG
jgi:hypothetical protein